MPIQCDLRDEEAVKNAFDKTFQTFGGLDILINNASAISLTGTEETTMKKYDLMHSINTRGTYMASKYALPGLKKSSNAHILNISPPLLMKPIWFEPHVAYTMAKYGMSMCVLGMAGEFRDMGIAVNALWPRTAIWTAAMAMLGGGVDETAKRCRTVDIMSDSAYAILSKPSKSTTGNFFIDEELLRSEGITNFESYSVQPGHDLMPDFFIPEHLMAGLDVSGVTETAKSSQGSSGLENYFNKAKNLITDELKKEINATLVFTISGKNYLMELVKDRDLRIEQVQDVPKSDVTLTSDEETFLKIAKGELKPTNAFMSGKLKIKGNMTIAMKAEKLFKAIKV